MARAHRSPVPIEAAGDPPAPPAELSQTWADITRRRSPHVVRGLAWWIAGYSWREAARRVGIRAHVQLIQAAREEGILHWGHRTDRLVQSHRAIALEAADEQIHRLRSDPDAISTRDLTVMSGVSTDKVRDFEGWNRKGQAGEQPYGSALERIASELAPGDRISVSLTMSRSRDETVIEGETVSDPSEPTRNLPSASQGLASDAPGAKVEPHNPTDPQDSDAT